MKINFYHLDYYKLLNVCEKIMQGMNFQLLHKDARTGFISAIKMNEQISSVAWLDLKFVKNKTAVSISVIANLVSGSSGMVSSDRISENEFLEKLYHVIPSITLPDNQFKIQQEDVFYFKSA